WEGPGVVVLAGDVLDLVPGDGATTAATLRTHRELGAAARAFTREPDRELIYLIGNHDGRLAWDACAAEQVAQGLRARLALTADLRFETARGWRTVRVEHGHRFDPANAFSDARNPHDTPIGYHVANDIVPALVPRTGKWLAGLQRLNEPLALPRVI